MFEDSSTYNLLTSRPSGPVWCVIRVLPNNSFAAIANSSIVSNILTPPALPRPPAWICAFKTYFFVFNDFARNYITFKIWYDWLWGFWLMAELIEIIASLNDLIVLNLIDRL